MLSVYQLNHFCQKKGGRFQHFSVQNTVLAYYIKKKHSHYDENNFQNFILRQKKGLKISEMSNSLNTASFSLLKS